MDLTPLRNKHKSKEVSSEEELPISIRDYKKNNKKLMTTKILRTLS